MAAPTQEYPPWLSVSVTTLTDTAGEPTATATTVLNLPLTYYGPPIPLGTDGAWVYGGLSSPAPQASTSTTLVPTSTTTAIPSSSSSPTSFPISSSSSTVLLSSLTPLPSSTVVASTKSTNHTLVIALTTAIVGAAVLFALVGILICIWRRSLRRKSGHTSPHHGSLAGEAQWESTRFDSLLSRHPEETRAPGEGSPRGSGEEHDPFLRASAVATNGAKEAGPSARLVSPSQPLSDSNSPLPFFGALSWNKRKVQQPPPPPFSEEKDGSGSSNYATAEEGPKDSPHIAQQAAPSPISPRDRHIIPPRDLMKMYDSVPEPTPRSPRSPQSAEGDEASYDDVDVPLLSPRSARDNSRANRSRSNRSLRSGGTSVSEAEGAALLTARRVRVDEQHSPRPMERQLSTSQRWAQAVNLDSFTNLGRHSWVSRMLHGRSSPALVSRPTSTAERAMSPTFDADLDFNIDGLRTSDPLPSPPPPTREMGMLSSRPISSASAKSAASGGTIFYDAQSRVGTPVIDGTASTVASNYRPSPLRNDSLPPAYEVAASLQPPPAAVHAASVADLLDIPAPRPASPFTTVASSTTRLRPSPPPGLGMPALGAWRKSAGGISGSSTGSGEITIDVLEEAPPAAGESWSILRRAAGPEAERRMTFGTPAHAHLTSSHENVYSPSYYPSVHSSAHLHPRDASASGSMSGSGSGSSHLQQQSGSSGGSVSSRGHRLVRDTAVSPPLSAVGDRRAARVSDNSSSADHSHAAIASGMGTIGSHGTNASVTTHGSTRDARTGEVMHFPYVPYTAGLEPHAEDASSEGWGGS